MPGLGQGKYAGADVGYGTRDSDLTFLIIQN